MAVPETSEAFQGISGVFWGIPGGFRGLPGDPWGTSDDLSSVSESPWELQG